MFSKSNPLGLACLTAGRSRRVALAGTLTVVVAFVAACHPKSAYLRLASQPQFQLVRESGAAPVSKAPGANIVKAELSEWRISVASDSVSPGPVTLQVHNAGALPHVFEVEGSGIEKRTGAVAPDSTFSLTVDLQPGRYEIYCPLGAGKHRKMGMETDLTVRSER